MNARILTELFLDRPEKTNTSYIPWKTHLAETHKITSSTIGINFVIQLILSDSCESSNSKYIFAGYKGPAFHTSASDLTHFDDLAVIIFT